VSNVSKPSPAPLANVVIRASAGTGKTFQLSNRYLGLAAAGESPDRILATTFTRKAAGEILDRVLFRLAEAALDPGALARLAGHLAAADFDRARCLGLLCEMIGQLHRLRVATLDSFFIQVARSFSLELGLPPGWRIVDEIEDRTLRDEAIREVLARQSTGDVVRLMHLLSKGEATRSVADQIRTLVRDLYALYGEAPPGAWTALHRKKPLAPAEIRAAIEAAAAAELPPDQRLAKARDRDLAAAEQEDWEAFLGKGLTAKILDGSLTYCRKPIPQPVVDAYEMLLAHAEAQLIDEIANQTEATHALLEHFDGAYARIKARRRGYRFDDVTRRLGRTPLRKRLGQVAYRLDAGVAHLLLDEFQDTSPLQWRVLRPFAEQIVRPGGRGSFFCVGDVKQAIYGWRGGVAEIFEALEKELDGLERRFLDRSFRSSQPVIDTVNQVFHDLVANPALEKYPQAAQRWSKRFTKHTTARADLPGYCRLATAPVAGEDKKDQAAVTLAFAADEVRRLVEQCPGRSIGILVRKNRAVARMIYELRERKIAASEEGGNPLIDSAAVELVMSLLTLADHPGDTVARFHVARSPLAEPLGLVDHGDGTAASRLAARIRRDLAFDGYGPTIRRWTELLAGACNRRDLNRLLQLVELAYAYEPAATARADDFVRLVAQRRVEDPSSADVRVMTFHQAKGLQFDIVVLPELDTRLVGQVPAMVVGRPGPTAEIERICRYVGSKLRPLLPRPFQDMFDLHQTQVVEEALCVLYVALTRAACALVMIVAPQSPKARSVGSTAAGLLRAALAPGVPAEPETVLYQHGDPHWHARAPAAPPTEKEPAQEPREIRLAPPPPRSRRGLQRRSPSSLEGGLRVDLRRRLRLEADAALDFGTAVHKCFEQVGWLEDGLPDDETLRRELASLGLHRLDPAQAIARFRQALQRPALRAALSRATYAAPAAGEDAAAVHAPPEMAQPRWQVWRERDFVIRAGDSILHGSIDRLVVLYHGDRPVAADVIDFKTDSLEPNQAEAIEAKREHYRPQLEAYRQAVAQRFGLEPSRISARLAFVGAGRMVPV